MKKLIYLTLISTAFFSCTKNFEEINTPPKDPVTASTDELFNGIISSLPLAGGEYAVMNSWIYPMTQQGVVAGSNSYNFDHARGALWTTYYQALANYRLIQSRIEASATPANMNNLYAMLKTLIAYKTFKNTNYFGNMPYSKAGYAPINGSSGYNAPYDKQEDIYPAILTDLKWAVDNLSTAGGQYSPGNYDTFLKGDIAKWIKFANSLRLYVAITMYDKNSSLAGPQIAEALAKPLLTDGEDIGLWPTAIPGLEFQWRQWSFTQDCNLRMGSTMWNLLSDNNNTDGNGIFDIRAKIFFETNRANNWVAIPQNQATITETGAPYNIANRDIDWNNKGNTNYSAFNFYFVKDVKYIPELMLTAAQVHFLKAEAYNRGLGVTANQTAAKAAYDAGVTASLTLWKKIAFNTPSWAVNKPAQEALTAAELSQVLNNSKVAYNTADAAGSLLKIYAQTWIDQYRQPFDAWTLLRRTGGKTPMAATDAGSYTGKYGKLYKFRYPDEEQSFNNANWKAETGGSDVSDKKIWIQP
ncbi:SusD/RagB family nutrient-binding outer membrane lipoprotein [Niabella sp. 22666]|uniref:SusD/RagB family nutrient-binding outer membrane lipoprotein n=1 Tax=Niabella sp. 22666 TaxID=3453954 RepID=UPI003F867A1F